MPRTPLFRFLKKAFRLSQLSSLDGMPPADEIAEWVEHQRNQAPDSWSRRRFLRQTAQAGLVLGAGSMLTGCLPEPPKSKSPQEPPAATLPDPNGPRIVIVGAGLSGLHAGHLLKKTGLNAGSLRIFDAANRTGGRLITTKLFGNNMTTEFGGEFIDSDHKDMFALAREFNIVVLDKKKDTLIGDAFFFDGRHYSLEEAVKSFQKCSKKIAKDFNSLGEDYDTPAAVKLDKMTLKAYIDSLKTDAWFKKLLEEAYVGEFGLECSDQSAINMIDMMGAQSSGFELFGESDERYKLLGGNQQICDRLAEKLADHIQLGKQLTAVKDKGDGFTLTFTGGGSTQDVDADFVIMTIPFTILRDVEGIDKLAKMTPDKLKCIKELGYGTNSKIMMGLKNRPWRTAGYQGYLYSETIHTSWDSYHFQTPNNDGPSVYTIFLGGAAGLAATPEKASDYIPVLDKAFPGFSAAHDPTQRAAMNWTANPLSKGSYATYRVGQWTSISGKEIEPVGNMYFAGDHCSSDFQGYMNGAAETGRVAAEAIIARVKK